MKPKGDVHPKDTLKKVSRKGEASSSVASLIPPKRKPLKGKDQSSSKNLVAAKKIVHNLRNFKNQTASLDEAIPHFLRRHSLRSQNSIDQDVRKKPTKSKSKDTETKPKEKLLQSVTTQLNLAVNDLKSLSSETDLEKKESESKTTKLKCTQEKRLLEKKLKSITTATNATKLKSTETVKKLLEKESKSTVNVQKKHYNLRRKCSITEFDLSETTPSKLNLLKNGVPNNTNDTLKENNNEKNVDVVFNKKFAVAGILNTDNNNDITMLDKYSPHANNDIEKGGDSMSELLSSKEECNNNSLLNIKKKNAFVQISPEEKYVIGEILENMINAIVEKESFQHDGLELQHKTDVIDLKGCQHDLESYSKTNAVIEQEDSKHNDLKIPDKSEVVIEQKDYKHDDLEIQNKTDAVIKQEDSKRNDLETQNKTDAVIEQEDSKRNDLETQNKTDAVIEQEESKHDDLQTHNDTDAVMSLEDSKHDDLETQNKTDDVIEQSDSKHDDETSAVIDLEDSKQNALEKQSKTDVVDQQEYFKHDDLETKNKTDEPISLSSIGAPKLIKIGKINNSKNLQSMNEELVNKAYEKTNIKSNMALKEYRKPKHGSKIDTINNHVEKSFESPQAEVSNELDEGCNGYNGENNSKCKLKSTTAVNTSVATAVNAKVLCSDQKNNKNQYKIHLTDQGKVINQVVKRESLKDLILKELVKSNGKCQLNNQRKVIEINTTSKVNKQLLDLYKNCSAPSVLDKKYSSKLCEFSGPRLNTMITKKQNCSIINKSLKEKILDIKQEVDLKKSLTGPKVSRSVVLNNVTDQGSVSHSNKSGVPLLQCRSDEVLPCITPNNPTHKNGSYELNRRMSKANNYIIKKPAPIKLTARKGSAKNTSPNGAPTGKLSSKITLPSLDTSNMHTYRENIPTILERGLPNTNQSFSRKFHTPSNSVSKTDCHHCLLSRNKNTNNIISSQSSGKDSSLEKKPISQNDAIKTTQKTKKSDGPELPGVKKQTFKRKNAVKVTKNDLIKLKESHQNDISVIEESITTTTTVKKYIRKKNIRTSSTQNVKNTTFTYQQSCTLNVNQTISNQEPNPDKQICPHNRAWHKCHVCSFQSPPHIKRNSKQCNSICSVCGSSDTPSCRCIGSRVKFNQQRSNPNGFQANNGQGLTKPSIPHIEMAFPQYLYDSRTRAINAPILADFMENKVCPVFHSQRTYSGHSTAVRPYVIRIFPIEGHETNRTGNHESQSQSCESFPVTHHNGPNFSSQKRIDKSIVIRCIDNHAVQNRVQNNIFNNNDPSNNGLNDALFWNDSTQSQLQNPTFTCCGYNLDSTEKRTHVEKQMNNGNSISSTGSSNSYQNITGQTQHQNERTNYANPKYSSYDEYIPNGIVENKVAKEINIYNRALSNTYSSNDSPVYQTLGYLDKSKWEPNDNPDVNSNNIFIANSIAPSTHSNYSRITYHDNNNMHTNTVNDSIPVDNVYKNQVNEPIKIDSIIGRVEEISSTPEVVHGPWDEITHEVKISNLDNDLVNNSMDHSVKPTDLNDICKTMDVLTIDEMNDSNGNKSKIKNDFDHIIVCGEKELYENETLTPKRKGKIITNIHDQKQGKRTEEMVKKTDQTNETVNISGARGMDENIARVEEITTTDECPTKINSNYNEDHTMIDEAFADSADTGTVENIINKSDNVTVTGKPPTVSCIIENIKATAAEIENSPHTINGILNTERLETIQSFDNARMIVQPDTNPNTNKSYVIHKEEIHAPKISNVSLNDEEAIEIEDIDFGVIDIEKYLDTFGVPQNAVSTSIYNTNSHQMDTPAYSNYQNEFQHSSDVYSSPFSVPSSTISAHPNPPSLNNSPDQSNYLNSSDYSWLYSNLASYLPQDADSLISSIEVNTFLDSPTSRPENSLGRDKAKGDETPRSVRKSPISIRSIPNKIKIRHQPNEDNYIRVQQSASSPYQRVNIAKDAVRSNLLQSFDQYNTSRTPSPAARPNESTRRTWSRPPRTTPREDCAGSPPTSDYCPSPNYNVAWLPATSSIDTLSHRSYTGSVSSDQGYAGSCTPSQSGWTPNNSSPNKNGQEAPPAKSRANAAPCKTYLKTGRVSKKKSNLNSPVGKKLRDCLTSGKVRKDSRLKSKQGSSEKLGSKADVASTNALLSKTKAHGMKRSVSSGKPSLTTTAYQSGIASTSATNMNQGEAACATVVACVYKAYGCTVRMPTSAIMGHEFSCPHQCVKCPAHPCKWYAKLLFFNAHVSTQHLQYVENSPRALFKIRMDLVNSLQIFYQKFGSFIYIFLVKVMDTFIRGQVAYIRTPRHEYNHHYISLEIKSYGKTRAKLTCPVPMFLGPMKESLVPGKKTKLLIKRLPSEEQPSFLELFTEIFVPKVTVNISPQEKAIADRYAKDGKFTSSDSLLTHRMALLKKITEAINSISNTSFNMMRLESKPSVLTKTKGNVKKKAEQDKDKLTAEACAASLMKEMMKPKIKTKSGPTVVKEKAKPKSKSLTTKINDSGPSNMKKENQIKYKPTAKSLIKVLSKSSVCFTSTGSKDKFTTKAESCATTSHKAKSMSDDTSSNTAKTKSTSTPKSCPSSSNKKNKPKATVKPSTNDNLIKAKSKSTVKPFFPEFNIENKPKFKSTTKSMATNSKIKIIAKSKLNSKSVCKKEEALLSNVLIKSESTNKGNKSKPSGKNLNVLSDRPPNIKDLGHDNDNFRPVVLKCWSVVPEEDQYQDLAQSDQPQNIKDIRYEKNSYPVDLKCWSVVPDETLQSWSVLPDQTQSQHLVQNLRCIRIQRVRTKSQEDQYRSFYSDSDRMLELVDQNFENHPSDDLHDSSCHKLMNKTSNKLTDTTSDALKDKLKDITSDKFNDIASDKFNAIASDKFNDIASDKFNDIASDKFYDIASDKFNDITSNKFNDIASDKLVDIASDELLDIASDKLKEITLDKSKDIASDKLMDTTSDLLKDINSNKLVYDSTSDVS